MSSHRVVIGLWVTAYVIVMATANLLTSTFGLVPAGWGMAISAGTYTAGLALALRDTLYDLAGARVVLVALAAGAVCSAVTADPRIVIASTVAATIAELVDFAVYVPVRRRSRAAAIAVSGLAGAVVDTVGFLTLAGFPLSTETAGGQLLVKAVWVSGAYLLVGEGVRRVVSRQRQHTRYPHRDPRR